MIFLHGLIKLTHCLKKKLCKFDSYNFIGNFILFFVSVIYTENDHWLSYLTSSCCWQAVWVYPYDILKGSLWSWERIPSGLPLPQKGKEEGWYNLMWIWKMDKITHNVPIIFNGSSSNLSDSGVLVFYDLCCVCLVVSQQSSLTTAFLSLLNNVK